MPNISNINLIFIEVIEKLLKIIVNVNSLFENCYFLSLRMAMYCNVGALKLLILCYGIKASSLCLFEPYQYFIE